MSTSLKFIHSSETKGGVMPPLEQRCLDRGLRISEQRKVILHDISEARDHPCADEIHQRVTEIDPRISLATTYRTLNTLGDLGLLSRIDVGDGKAHYEEASDERHEHLIDVRTGKVLEFRNDEIATLLQRAAAQLGYRLADYRLELFGEPALPQCRAAG